MASDLMVGDRVRVDGGNHPEAGRAGWVAAIDSDGIAYVDTGDQDDWIGPFTAGQLTAVDWCEWFLRCPREAIGIVSHPVLGDVPVCDPCRRSVTGPALGSGR